MLKFLVIRLAKTLTTGACALLGPCLVLAGFGIISEWNFFSDGTFLHDLWVKPWSILAAIFWFGVGIPIFWFGVGILFFTEEAEEKPLLSGHETRQLERLFRRVSELLEEENFPEALEVLQLSVKRITGFLENKRM